VHVSACIAKSDAKPIPSSFKAGTEGVTDVACDADHITYDVGSLDLRK
jgi:hypothetical protein